MDIYQERYLAHQDRKNRILAGNIEAEDVTPALFGAIAGRVSQRTFNKKEISPEDLAQIYEVIRLAPSSCNRQAILIKKIVSAANKRQLDALLVGGKNWLAGAKIVLLLFADMLAYKSPAETGFMPYLDAGVVIENIYLAATALDIGACYVNPHIRDEDKVTFNQQFNADKLRFCGAMALGKYDFKTPRAPKRQLEWIFC